MAYESERYNPSLPHCANLRLKFDGNHLWFVGAAGPVYPAVSGRPLASGAFDYSVARQKLSATGPIPEGIYWIRPDELDDNTVNCWVSGKFCAAWGKFRITIHPFTTTDTYGRGGFFIHGGSVPGSAGCIDLTTEIDTFAADLVKLAGKSACQIHLHVSYPVMGDFTGPRGSSRSV